MTDEQLQSLFAGMEQHLDRRMDVMERRMDAFEHRMDGFESRFEAVEQKIEKVETTLLTEFHKWASPIETRMQTHRSWFREVDDQLEALKDRVSKLEKRQN